MFKNRIFMLSILVLLTFSVVGPVSAAPKNQDSTATPTEAVASTETVTLVETETATPTATPSATPSLAVTSTATAPADVDAAAASSTPTAPAGFTKISPAKDATDINQTAITFSWKAYSPAPEKYRWCIDTSDNDICDASGGYTSATGTSVTLSNFDTEETYYWHVQAITCSSCNPKTIIDTNGGTWWSFSTGEGTPTRTPTKTRTPTRTMTPTKTATITPTATLVTYAISGNTGIAGATLKYTEGTLKTITSDGAGNYSFRVSPGWNGTVTVSRDNYTFITSSRDYTLTPVTANLTNQDYAPVETSHHISGQVNDVNVTISFYDGANQTVLSDASGNYTVLVLDNLAVTITPSKTNETFSPVSSSYPAGAADITGEDYTPTLTLTSIAAQDGWVLESTETSGVGGTKNGTSNILVVGDDASRRQYRSFLAFNTAGLPDNAVIQSALIKVRQSGKTVGVSPFKVLGKLALDIRKGFFGTSSLLPADFNTKASANKVGYFLTKSVAGWFSATLGTVGRNSLNKLGTTQFRLYFTLDDNNNPAANYIKFATGETASKPTLAITFTLP